MVGPTNRIRIDNRVDQYERDRYEDDSLPEEESSYSVTYEDPKPPFDLEVFSEQSIDKFFQQEPYFSKQTQEFVKAIFDQAVFSDKIRITDKERVQNFMDEVKASVQLAISMCKKINFSRSYEKEGLTYPSTEEMKDLVDLILTIKKRSNEFEHTEDFSSQFNQVLSPFLIHLENQIREQASRSRALKIMALERDSYLEPKNKEYELAIAKHHLDALKNQPGQHWSELNAILNLSRFNWLKREPTEKELKFFHFITMVYDKSCSNSQGKHLANAR